METPHGEHPSSCTPTFIQPPLHHRHQILLPFHHHHHHHLVKLTHCCAVHGLVQPPNQSPFLPPIPTGTPPATTSVGAPPIQSSEVIEEQEDAYEELEEEAEEEPIFVLTDEWKEFFAKSEAKRREAKKQARKQGKK